MGDILLTPEQAASDADKLMHVIRDVASGNPDHQRLGKHLAEAIEWRDQLTARIAQHDAATLGNDRIKLRMRMETILNAIDRLATQAVMSAANPTGDPEKHMRGDDAEAEVSRRLALLG
jgi:hypothetical protein